MNYAVVYLGCEPNQKNKLNNIFNLTSYNIIKILDSPFFDCYSNIAGIINFFNNITTLLPKSIKIYHNSKIIRMFLVNEISNRYIITHNFKFDNILFNNKYYDKFKKSIQQFLNYIHNNKKKAKFIFVRYCSDKNKELKFYNYLYLTIQKKFNIINFMLLLI